MDETEAYVINVADWHRPFIEFLSYSALPEDKQAVAIIKRKSTRFKLREGELFYCALNETYFQCLAQSEAIEALKAAHQLEYQGVRKLFAHLLYKGFYWPTMEHDAKSYVQKCKPFQHYHHQIYTPATPLHPIEGP
ncbi:uncharacterized protein LOC132272392 [Cornus florida]|uniref:uncharacterized protein LOC132272392 n=1 Tax=Cornus florida TaxID=4283 RepID=UPI002899E3A7|nr:uncharacterized protein LOC132272392 [Cornus florida]